MPAQGSGRKEPVAVRLAAATVAGFLCFVAVACAPRGATTSAKTRKTVLVEVYNRWPYPLDVGVWSDIGIAPGLPNYAYSTDHGDQSIPPNASAFWRLRPGSQVTRVAVVVDPKTPYWWAHTFNKQQDFPSYYLHVIP